MSILSHIAQREADGLMSIDIPTSTTVSLPHVPLDPGSSESFGFAQHIADARPLVRTLLCGIGSDDITAASLEAAVDQHVDVWTPALHTTTRFELISALEDSDDAIGEVVVVFTEAATSGSIAILGWQATGRFVRPVFLDGDHLLEPTGAVIRLAGTTSVGFTRAGRARSIRCYYDRLSLVEQIAARRPRTTMS